MNETFTPREAPEQLKPPKDARLHQAACAEKDPGDGSLVQAALNDFARSANMGWLAPDVGVTREGTFKAMLENGNPSLARSCGSPGRWERN